MATLVHPSDKFPLAVHALPTYQLLVGAEPTKHGGAFYFLVGIDRLIEMALIAAEFPPATPIPNPPEAELHMLTGTPVGQLFFILDDFALFEEGVEKSKSHVRYLHLPEALVAVSTQPGAWQADSGLDDFGIASTSYFPADASNFNESAILDSQPTDHLRAQLHDFSLDGNWDMNLALPALELDPDLQLFSIGFQDVHQLFLALALNVQEESFGQNILGIGDQQGV